METDNIVIRLVPEKKGLILKHSEYEIFSKRLGVSVCRRYNDFVNLHNLLSTKFPFRMLPRLPPKQLMLDSFLEERRRGLQRYLQILCMHPVIGKGEMLGAFLTDKSSEHQDHLRIVFLKQLDEFSQLSDNFELPLEDQGRLAANRERMRLILNSVIRLKRLFDQFSNRLQNQVSDFNDMSSVLKSIDKYSNCFDSDTISAVTESVANVSLATAKCSATQFNLITEKLAMLLDILTGHSDLCDRVEKGIVSDHQKAVSKMLNINKQKIKGVIRGSAAENVEALHKQEVEQTGVVGTLERKSAFSLYCVLEETSLAQKYLEVLPSIVLSFTYEQQKLAKESNEIWQTVLNQECSKLNQ